MGIDNLVALTANKPGFQSVLVNGRPVKSINQYYNKRKADLQKQLGHAGTTKRNADINGAGNTIRKVAPDAFGTEGVEDGKGVLASLVVHPVRFVIPPSRTQQGKS
ncbi:MAG: hypothetical protein JO202_17300 [Ktedonobacteraceae bacterium]|nr:hypothetical protein [Ktedonobacteraceae bacterium]